MHQFVLSLFQSSSRHVSRFLPPNCACSGGLILFGILPAYFYFLAMGIATTLYLVILLAILALVAAIVLARP